MKQPLEMTREQIIELRRYHGDNQQAFAKRVGVCWATVNRWESMNPATVTRPYGITLEKLRTMYQEMEAKRGV